MTVNPESNPPDVEQPFIVHLIELRNRLLRIVAAVSLLLVALLPFTNIIYVYVATPLMARMPAGTHMIATSVASPFMVPFKLTMLTAIVFSIPYILYQIWGFIAPGLYLRERSLILPLLVSSTLLFYLGMAFAYYIVFPIIFGFFIATAPTGVAVMTDIGQYLDFVLALFLAFGTAFEIPIATILLVWMGVLTQESLIDKRPYIIVGVFVVAMFLTPPDALSQTLLAVPMWLLFEAGLFFSKYFIPRNAQPDIPVTPIATNESSSNIVDTLPAPSFINQDFRPMTDAEMEAELDAADVQEAQLRHSSNDAVDLKLLRINKLRQEDNLAGARALLYQVLSEGNEQQRIVARNILEQLDS